MSELSNSNSCRAFASESLQASLRRPAEPPGSSSECSGYEDQRGKYVMQLRIGASSYLFGPFPLRQCKHLRHYLLLARHVGPYCSCTSPEECPQPWNSAEQDWAADIVEIATDWPADVPTFIAPEALEEAHKEQSATKKPGKTAVKLARELQKITPISKFAIFRASPALELPPPPPKKPKPKQKTLQQLFQA